MHAIPIILSAIFLWQCAIDIDPATLVAAPPQESIRVDKVYDDAKGRTTVKLRSIEISAGQDKYVSVRMSPSFSFGGRNPATPEIVDFELQTVVRGRLRTDLYVVFLIDGEKVFLSSNRWAVKRPVRGRVWVGEHLVFRMPYETFVRITKATSVAIKFDAVLFPLSESQQQVLRDFLVYMKPESAPTSHR
jgi:hypothetical protein